MAVGEMSPHCYLVADCSDKVSEPQSGGSCRVSLPLRSPFGVLLSNWGIAVRRSIRQKCIDPLAMTGHTGLSLISFLRIGWIAEYPHSPWILRAHLSLAKAWFLILHKTVLAKSSHPILISPS